MLYKEEQLDNQGSFFPILHTSGFGYLSGMMTAALLDFNQSQKDLLRMSQEAKSAIALEV